MGYWLVVMGGRAMINNQWPRQLQSLLALSTLRRGRRSALTARLLEQENPAGINEEKQTSNSIHESL